MITDSELNINIIDWCTACSIACVLFIVRHYRQNKWTQRDADYRLEAMQVYIVGAAAPCSLIRFLCDGRRSSYCERKGGLKGYYALEKRRLSRSLVRHYGDSVRFLLSIYSARILSYYARGEVVFTGCYSISAILHGVMALQRCANRVHVIIIGASGRQESRRRLYNTMACTIIH